MNYSKIMKKVDYVFSATPVDSPYGGGIQGLSPEGVYDTIEDMITREPTGSLYHLYNRLLQERDEDLACQIVVIIGNYPGPNTEEFANVKVINFLTRVLIGHPNFGVRDTALDQLDGCNGKGCEGATFRKQFAYELEDHPSMRRLYEEHYLKE